MAFRMAVERSYLDFNASAPLLPAARQAMLAALDLSGNASSVHSEGRAARQAIEQARRSVAALANARADHVTFTSGATEAASWLLSPHWRMGRSPLTFSHLYACAADHACIRGGGRFAPEQVSLLPVDADGILDLAALKAALAAHDREGGLALVAVHAANNETGVIQPVTEIGHVVREAGGVLVVDAVQAAGRIKIDISEGYGDFLILSSHKIGGPKGVGAVVGQADLMMPAPMIAGGGQEHGHRSGTENIAAIAGFGAAAEAAADLAPMRQVEALRDEMQRAVLGLVPDAVIFGAGAPRLPNTLSFAIPGMKAETLMIGFDLAGVAVSAGSACSSGKVGPSHVLEAMGHGADASGVRVSIGRETGSRELEHFRSALKSIAERRISGPRAA
jgi:cysteine desulfurase